MLKNDVYDIALEPLTWSPKNKHGEDQKEVLREDGHEGGLPRTTRVLGAWVGYC